MASSSGSVDPEFVAISADGVVVRMQVTVYGADAVARAAHRFTDRCFVHLEYEDEDHLLCRLRAKRPVDDPHELAGEFANEVLDQMLRERIAAETEQTRLLLLAHAFSNTSILHPELDADAPSEDPVGIGEADESREPRSPR